MTRRAAGFVTMTAAVALMAWGIGSSPLAAQAGPAAGKVSAEHGKYLVEAIGGCNDCHTPYKMGDNGPEPDMTRMLSGHPSDLQLPPPPAAKGPWIAGVDATFTAWWGPWGISYTKNLTPDKETGLGLWTEQQFVDTIRNGREQGHGRQLLPPMPWEGFRNMTDDDLKSIFAFLKTIPAIKNKVPDPVIAPPPGQ
jgi:mono/diheme cytochrome c family protein